MGSLVRAHDNEFFVWFLRFYLNGMFGQTDNESKRNGTQGSAAWAPFHTSLFLLHPLSSSGPSRPGALGCSENAHTIHTLPVSFPSVRTVHNCALETILTAECEFTVTESFSEGLMIFFSLQKE